MPKTQVHAKIVKKTMTKSKRSGKPKKSILVPYLLVVALAVGTFLFLTEIQHQQQTISKAAGDCMVSAADIQTKPAENDFLKRINDYRATKGAPALIMSQQLKRPAQWYANDSARQFLAGTHNDSLGRTPIQRYADCGVRMNSSAENKLKGANTAAEAINLWKNSPGHNRNMLNPTMKQIGIGIKGDSWVTVFSGDNLPAGSGNPGANSSSSISPNATNAVPSPTCLGGCTVSPPVNTGSISASPIASVSPETTVPTNTGTTKEKTSLLALILQLFLILFQALFSH